MKPKHTPGPWSFDTFAGKTCVVSGDAKTMNGIATLTELNWAEYRLKSASKKNEILKEQIANARLIAAAPELYAWTRELLIQLKIEAPDKYAGVLEHVESLIARIEGGTE